MKSTPRDSEEAARDGAAAFDEAEIRILAALDMVEEALEQAKQVVLRISRERSRE